MSKIIVKIIIWVLEHYKIEEQELDYFDRVIIVNKENVKKMKKEYGDDIKIGWRINIPIRRVLKVKDYKVL